MVQWLEFNYRPTAANRCAENGRSRSCRNSSRRGRPQKLIKVPHNHESTRQIESISKIKQSFEKRMRWIETHESNSRLMQRLRKNVIALRERWGWTSFSTRYFFLNNVYIDKWVFIGDNLLIWKWNYYCESKSHIYAFWNNNGTVSDSVEIPCSRLTSSFHVDGRQWNIAVQKVLSKLPSLTNVMVLVEPNSWI